MKKALKWITELESKIFCPGNTFPHVAQAYLRLVEAIHLNTYTITKVDKDEPKWKRDDLKSVMSKLVEFSLLIYFILALYLLCTAFNDVI